MPLQVEFHTVLYLKGLTRGIEHTNRHGCGSNFTLHQIRLKSIHFASKTGQMMVSFDRICIQSLAFRGMIWEIVVIKSLQNRTSIRNSCSFSVRR